MQLSQNQAHCTYVWRHKDVKAQREKHVTTHHDWKISSTHSDWK